MQETVSGSGISWAVCKSAPRFRHASTPPLSFLLAGCLSCGPTNRVKALKALLSLPTTKTENIDKSVYTHTHTHMFNGPCAGTTRVNWYQKGKTSLDLNEARDGGVLGCSSLSWTICKQSAPHFRQITTPTVQHLITEFVQTECSS